MNWRVIELVFCEPESFSFVCAAAYREWYAQHGIETHRLVVDSFLLMDPYTILRLHALPFWLVFCTQPSADTLRRFLDSQPPFDEIDLMLFSHGTEGIGVTRIDEWKELLGRASREGRFLGVDTRRYPRDFATFVRFDQALRELGPQQTPPPPMTLEQFESVFREHGPKHGVSMTIHPRGIGSSCAQFC